jgi:hypothetical protein
LDQRGCDPGGVDHSEHPAGVRGLRDPCLPFGPRRPAGAAAPTRGPFRRRAAARASAHTEPQPWWLGFLETGASDVVLDDAPRVHVYHNWPYVLVQAGPQEARNWRSDEGRWHTALPELMFPVDHSWLVSSLWDDAWAGVGGSDALVSALLTEPDLSPEKTDPSVPDMWPSSMPDEMHHRLRR